MSLGPWHATLQGPSSYPQTSIFSPFPSLQHPGGFQVHLLWCAAPAVLSDHCRQILPMESRSGPAPKRHYLVSLLCPSLSSELSSETEEENRTGSLSPTLLPHREAQCDPNTVPHGLCLPGDPHLCTLPCSPHLEHGMHSTLGKMSLLQKELRSIFCSSLRYVPSL